MQSNSVDTVYILSPGHSGSTLLNLLLGSHTRVVGVSELTYLAANVAQREICTCGQVITQCPLWSVVAAQVAASTGHDLFADPLRFELGLIDSPHGAYRAGSLHRRAWKLRRKLVYFSQMSPIGLPSFMRARFDTGIRNRLAIYDAVRKASGAAVVIDASKGYLPGVAVENARPERTRLLLLTRDGRAVFNSNLRRGFGRDYSLRVWRNYYRYGLPLLEKRVRPEQILRVRYENLAGDPQGELARICAHMGLSFEAGMLDPASRQHHITSGNNMRFSKGIAIRLDTRWQSELTAEDRQFFESAAGGINRQLGYE